MYKKYYCNILIRVLIIFSFNLFTIAIYCQAFDSATTRSVITKFYETQASVKYIYQCTLNKDATAIAWCGDGENGQSIFIRSLSHLNDSARRISAADSLNQACNETEPLFSADGKKIAFLSDAKTGSQLQVFIADAFTGNLITQQSLTHFDGYVSHLKWSPDGKFISVLYVEKASRNPNPMAALNRNVGLIDSSINKNVQHIAVINLQTNETTIVTPKSLYIFEYDWSPDSKSFCYTAAPSPGDDNWYIAKLYTQKIFSDDTIMIYQPKFQIALPRWSNDGKQIAFIEGLMSDQGGTGGEMYVIGATKNSKPKDLTPKRTSTPSWFTWEVNSDILFTEFVDGSVAVSSLNSKTLVTHTLWKADESIRAGEEETSLAVAENKFALIRSSWNKLPEVWFGNFKDQTQLTHLNDAVVKPLLRFENITWMNEGNHVQGWLLYPQQYDSTKKYPMLVCVHGGPAWITTPTWAAPDFNTTAYTQFGYFVFFPNA
ncbi:MAG: PD40 domain-containing protein, partial [Parafilimonas sp.]|nr:PD40 domain-containing protein [Parafilimonas sp.]